MRQPRIAKSMDHLASCDRFFLFNGAPELALGRRTMIANLPNAGPLYLHRIAS